jgi:hypothetical protein
MSSILVPVTSYHIASTLPVYTVLRSSFLSCWMVHSLICHIPLSFGRFLKQETPWERSLSQLSTTQREGPSLLATYLAGR